jgi:hypothetical protein
VLFLCARNLLVKLEMSAIAQRHLQIAWQRLLADESMSRTTQHLINYRENAAVASSRKIVALNRLWRDLRNALG